MTAPVWLHQAEGVFWNTAGPPPFPRDLEIPAPWAFLLAIIKLERLCLRAIEDWLSNRHIGYYFTCTDRRLHGCLLAYAGAGVIFLDGSDGEVERRFTLAHEIAHFWLDYLHPRREAIRIHGPGIIEVLDGYRPATHQERLTGILAGRPLGLFVDLLQRDDRGRMTHTAVLDSEEKADRLALALLAPQEEVLACLGALPAGLTRSQRVEVGTEVVQQQFGLPQRIAQIVARQALGRIDGPVSFAEWLKS